MAKSNEVKLNKALAKLKKRAPASKYEEVAGKLPALFPNVEAQVECVKTALKQFTEADPLEEALSDPAVAILFGREPKKKETIKETAPVVVVKHNGASENFVEGSPLNEGRSAANTETANTRKNIFAKGDAILIENMTHPVTKQRLTEAEKRMLTGGKPAEYGNLTAKQQKEFDAAKMLGFSEGDAMKLARLELRG